MADPEISGWSIRKVAGFAVFTLAGLAGLHWWQTSGLSPDASISGPLVDHIFAAPWKVMDDEQGFPRLGRDAIEGVEKFDCVAAAGNPATGRYGFTGDKPSFDCALLLRGSDGRAYLTGAHLVVGGTAVGGFDVYVMPPDRFVAVAQDLAIALP